jgi:hypothetical protein
MYIGIVTVSREEKEAARRKEEKEIDRRLLSLGLVRKHVPKDGACLVIYFFFFVANRWFGSQDLPAWYLLVKT